MDKRLSAAIAIVITVVWATSYVVNAINPDYNPPAYLGPLMMLVAGAAFSTSVLAGKKNGKDTE